MNSNRLAQYGNLHVSDNYEKSDFNRRLANDGITNGGNLFRAYGNTTERNENNRGHVSDDRNVDNVTGGKDNDISNVAEVSDKNIGDRTEDNYNSIGNVTEASDNRLGRMIEDVNNSGNVTDNNVNNVASVTEANDNRIDEDNVNNLGKITKTSDNAATSEDNYNNLGSICVTSDKTQGNTSNLGSIAESNDNTAIAEDNVNNLSKITENSDNTATIEDNKNNLGTITEVYKSTAEVSKRIDDDSDNRMDMSEGSNRNIDNTSNCSSNLIQTHDNSMGNLGVDKDTANDKHASGDSTVKDKDIMAEDSGNKIENLDKGKDNNVVSFGSSNASAKNIRISIENISKVPML
jgi:hypothetical protein